MISSHSPGSQGLVARQIIVVGGIGLAIEVVESSIPIGRISDLHSLKWGRRQIRLPQILCRGSQHILNLLWIRKLPRLPLYKNSRAFRYAALERGASLGACLISTREA